ncbi:NIPSNAP family protein [Variovorax sp. GB1P17]|uniref:NIPSNAP family protein n=1 Tax=Variovorax sp. GB1P17 TaxID=3443740 RepID=UPI003F455CCC
MYIEQRTYTLVPGGAAEYLQAYKEMGQSVQEGHLGPMLGCFTREVGELNQLVYLWPFESMDERIRRRKALMEDADFSAFRKRIRHLVVRQENTVLVKAL